MSDVVLFREETATCGKKVAVATLNSEKSLNALSLQMIDLLMPQLLAWHDDDEVALVLLEGAGEKAFCAGGDVVDLYHACNRAENGGFAPEVERFFSTEYQLDYFIHTFDKPILLWGHGIVMGGGLGLMAGASHRVVTEKSRIAMPEITIGLYPDVGATYFLNRMPDGCGLFLGLTGASINALDAQYVHLADHCILSSRKDELLEKLIEVEWGNTVALNHQKLTDILIEFETQDKVEMPRGNISNHKELISSLANCERVESAVVNILDEHTDDKWLQKAQASLSHGSALTAHIIKKQLELGTSLSLADCFRLELGMSVQCAAVGEFAEGVRALLIDKDNQPKWLYPTVHDVDVKKVNEIFTSPWTEHTHPLRTFGK
ncbi:MAG: enoyl-CoA hydratase/isomerase family protein [Gammaproteobacteria bacterium]|nr:enoyl-CoA hydratase/isomerase family protein [Gammaproteobacteria bacterium]